ncbi:MAG: hypothetical protein ABIQ95_09645 [Bdellovibrionia bacterium]
MKFFIFLSLLVNLIACSAPSVMERRAPASDLNRFLSSFEDALQARDLVSVKGYLADLKTHPLIETDYLDLISKASAPSAPPCFINSLIHAMHSAFPKYNIDDYFYSTGAIKAAGLKIILDEYLPKLSHQTSYSVLSSYPALTAKVGNAMKNNRSYGIFFHEGENAHWTLIYLNRNLKKSENCTAQILDTVGHAQVMTIKNAVEKGLPAGCKIAYADERRQYDTTTCSVFAITDFLELSESDDRPLNIAEARKNSIFGNLVKMKVAPSLMALAQSDIQGKSPSIHEMAERTSIVLPKQPLLDPAVQIELTRGGFCRDDLPTYFNSQKDVKINVGSKVLRDQYARKIIEQLLSSKHVAE